MSSAEGSELLFTVNGRNVVPTCEKREEELVGSEIYENDEKDVDETKILTLIWKSGKMGAAYYNFDERMLYVYEDEMDAPPQFFTTRSLYREVAPTYVVTVGQLNENYVKNMVDVVGGVDEGTVTTDTARSLPPNFFLLKPREYSFDTCKAIVCTLVANIETKTEDIVKEIFIHSLINFDNTISVHAVGALIKYLDKNWAYFMPDRDDMQFLSIKQISMKGHVLMDLTTLSALQVFSQSLHEANFKRGLQASNREALSIFRLFSASCKSKLGHTSLRNILLKPVNDMKELIKRLNFISFVLHPSNQEFVESLQENIKKLLDVSGILLKVKNSRANCREWHVLYKSIYHTVYINELSAPYESQCELLAELRNAVSIELISLESSISSAIDFSDGKIFGRPVIKFGLDQQLDAKKLRQQDIKRHVDAAARLAANQLPDYLDECAVVYLPEMGHLITIKEWEPGCDPEQLKDGGFKYMFTLRGVFHYKSPICLELDENLGDINGEIIAHETRILQRLSGFVIKYSLDIITPLKLLGTIDAMIAIAKVSAQNNYVRPTLNNNNIQEIQECRHPLLELVSNFESNDFYSGGAYSRIKIITGPNGSGKSIHLKTVALAIYFAHIGSYIPAKCANIGMIHSLHSRLQTTESASLRLSSFSIDAIQVTQALCNSDSNSLILLDEFGRGTTPDEGVALLVGALRFFCRAGEHCPHILVSSHYQNISEFLPGNEILDHVKMTHSEENGTLQCLYKIEKGVSKSFALNIAAEVGLDQSIIERSRNLLENGTVTHFNNNYGRYPTFTPGDESSLVAFLSHLDIPELDED